jgi:flagellar biosynthesis protein FlhA
MSSAKTLSFDMQGFLSGRTEALLPAMLLGILCVMLVPLPTVLLDMLLAVNIATTVLVLLVALGVKHPLELSVFPALLLLMTLYRLSLNIATTRLILLDGAAGKIVETFGGLVVGGNLVVGLVIFLILVIVQFIVITKGANRISEVAARFTLDALPGKQMAIDAEFTAGTINEDQARNRRQEVLKEAEFYGAMDGASKFVRNDAIAGLIVTAINLLGGVILGAMRGLPFMDAVEKYSILTIGDGLVSQVPALIIATASGIVITKSTTRISLTQEIGKQLLADTKMLTTGAIILTIVAMTPGLPKIPFLALAGGLVYYVRILKRQKPIAPPVEELTTEQRAEQREKELLGDFIKADRVRIEIGSRLVPLAKSKGLVGLADRMPGLRKDLTQRCGFWIPPVRICDNLDLKSEEYRILVHGREVARGELRPGLFLVLNPEKSPSPIKGEQTVDPSFGIPARWVTAADRSVAELSGLTVVDASGVLITHLGEVLRRHAHELLSREDLNQMITKLKETAPTIVDELKPDVLRMSALHQILVSLLEEHVPITDLERIVESAVSHAARIKDPLELAEAIRRNIGRSICDPFRDSAGRLQVLATLPRLEIALRESMHKGEISLRARELERLVQYVANQVRQADLRQKPLAILTDSSLRRALRHALQRSLPSLSVIATNEIPQEIAIDFVATLDFEQVIEPMPREGTTTTERIVAG